MADKDGGESDAPEQRNTRFPCLAMVRTLMAIVVTGLAAVVLVMVIVAVNRPEKIFLSIDGNYVQAGQMWWQERQVSRKVPGGHSVCAVHSAGSDDSGQSTLEPMGHGEGVDTTVGDVDHGDDADCQDGGYTTELYPAEKVELRVSVTAYNPSGRGKTIMCNITTIRVIDTTSPNYTGVAFGSLVYSKENPVRCPVPPQSSHTKWRTVTINDTEALQYLYRRYQQITSFTALVQLDVTYSEKIGNISYYCYPVTVGYGVSSTRADKDTACKTSRELVGGYNISWHPPPLLRTT